MTMFHDYDYKNLIFSNLLLSCPVHKNGDSHANPPTPDPLS